MPMQKLFFILIALIASAPAFSEEADPAAGKAAYEASCSVCHGKNGASVIPANPILSGQHLDYLKTQIASYRSGERKNAVMVGMAATLTDQQIDDIATYLSQQPPVISGSTDIDVATLGERLYRGGSLARQLPACAACHGPTGAGIAALAPRLSGQYPQYTISALKAYTNGERNNPQMSSIAHKLSEVEMQQLAEFLAGLSY
ncbi:MAG: cytochrome c4 [Proteobacteria bacterium]|nr:cytochrome c4 [Pseudomonadota bacterium]